MDGSWVPEVLAAKPIIQKVLLKPKYLNMEDLPAIECNHLAY